MKKIFSVLLILFLMTGCGSKFETINYNEAVTLIEDGATIIDVRTSQEVETGYIEGAINIEVSDIGNIDLDKSETIIVYCATGVRSAQAAEELVDLGYESVYNLDGGILNWGAELVK